jgi:hypothetical protein
LRLFPQETQAITAVDVAAIRTAPILHELMSLPPFPGVVTEFIRETGFALDRDADAVTIGRFGRRDYLAVVRGRYDRNRVEDFFRARRTPFETVMGHIVHYPGDSLAISFPGEMILFGSGPGVRAGIERMSSVSPSDLRQNAAMMEGIRAIDAGTPVWAFGEFSEDMIPDVLRGLPQARELMQAIRTSALQMWIDQDVRARITAVFEDAESARTAADILRGFAQLAELQASETPDSLRLLNGVSIEDSGTGLTMGLTASGEILRKLMESRSPPSAP